MQGVRKLWRGGGERETIGEDGKICREMMQSTRAISGNAGVRKERIHNTMLFNTLQYSAEAYCSTLQRTATHCTYTRIACNYRSNMPAMELNGVVYTVQQSGDASATNLQHPNILPSTVYTRHWSKCNRGFPCSISMTVSPANACPPISRKMEISNHPISRDTNSNGNFGLLNVNRGTWDPVLANVGWGHFQWKLS